MIKRKQSIPTRPTKKDTRFKPGTPRPPNTGRAKGTPNKRTALLKDAILTAAALVGQDGKGKDGLVGYLKMLAVKEKAVYARLLEKVLPMQVQVEDKSVRKYTAEEAAQELRDRGLPVPLGLLQIAHNIGHAVTDEYENELNGVGIEGFPAPSGDSEVE